MDMAFPSDFSSLTPTAIPETPFRESLSSGARALLEEMAQSADNRLSDVDEQVRGEWSAVRAWRQPVHTLYIPADKFFQQVAEYRGEGDEPGEAIDEYVELARSQAHVALSTAGFSPAGEASLASFTRSLEALAVRLEQLEERAGEVAEITAAKLISQPIEDLRIDLEDGFTQRQVTMDQRDGDEDSHAILAAKALTGWAESTHASRPSFAGIRFKSFDPLTRNRGIRTLVLVLNHLHENGVLTRLYDPASPHYDPRALRLTFPKVQSHRQVEALVEILQRFEEHCGFPDGAHIFFEVQVETPQSIFGSTGHSEPMRIIRAAQGRCVSLHYGTYDYSAYLGVDAAYQSMDHPVADFAKDALQVACAATGVEVSDGSTNVIPVGNSEHVLEAWALHYHLVQRHLTRGIRQGWDLHPSQLLTRHLATVGYFRQQWETSAERLRDYVTGDESRWMDEPATAKALSSYLRRACQAGAITAEELSSYSLDLPMLEKLQFTGKITQ